MKALLKRYKYESITAGLCGTVCLALLAPFLLGHLRTWQRDRRTEPDGKVVVYQVRTGQPLLRGDSVREAVETRLRRVREVTAEVTGLEGRFPTWAEIKASMPVIDFEEARRLTQASRSFYAVDLRAADLRDLDFSGISLQYADFTDANLSGGNLEDANLSNATFANADLSGVHFGKRPELVPVYCWPAAGDAPGAKFHNCDLSGESLGGRLSGASFQGANLRGATLRLWNCERLDLSGADLTGGTIDITPNASPRFEDQGISPPERFYETVRFDDNTRVEGLVLRGVSDPNVPFVQWALAHGASLLDASPDSGTESPPETP